MILQLTFPHLDQHVQYAARIIWGGGGGGGGGGPSESPDVHLGNLNPHQMQLLQPQLAVYFRAAQSVQLVYMSIILLRQYFGIFGTPGG